MNKIEELKGEWFVFGIGKNAPNIAHSDKHTAIAESERLSKLCPGNKFLVCRIDSIVETVVTHSTTITRIGM